MRVSSKGIVNGVIADRFGAVSNQPDGARERSPPLEMTDVPDGTETFAVIMLDHDAIPVCGFSWIHWTVADLKVPFMGENASVDDPEITQGVNSCHSIVSEMSVADATGYCAPAPPDKIHEYEIRVYALDIELRMNKGFFLNELYRAMRGHVLAESVLYGTYAPKE